MFFRKKISRSSYYDLPPITSLRWMKQEVYDKDGKEPKLLRTEGTLQYKRNDGEWENVWNHYNSPIFLDSKNG
jgi:hypothetical protein